MKISELIDKFVTFTDPAGAIFLETESAPWIEALEKSLPKRFPASYRFLVTRYTFPSFAAGSLQLSGNPGDDQPDELSSVIFKDRLIADTSLKAGYIQFARPEGGSYDPICFDSKLPANNREFRIVRLDHEEILCHGRI